MCTQCSVLLHIIEICFLPCICLWQISNPDCIVVGPGFVSTSPAFMRNSASYPASPHGRRVHKTVNRAPIAGDWRGQHNLHSSLQPALVGGVLWSPSSISSRLAYSTSINKLFLKIPAAHYEISRGRPVFRDTQFKINHSLTQPRASSKATCRHKKIKVFSVMFLFHKSGVQMT